MKLGLKLSGHDLRTLERERLTNESDQVGALSSQTCSHRGNGYPAGRPFCEKCDGSGERGDTIIIRAWSPKEEEVGTGGVRLKEVNIRSCYLVNEVAGAMIAFVSIVLFRTA